jgi:hypothetical protein
MLGQAERGRALSSSIVSRAKVLIGIGIDDRRRGSDPQLDAFVGRISGERREETE